MVVTHRIPVGVVGSHGDDADAHGHSGGVGDSGGQEHDERHRVAHAEETFCEQENINYNIGILFTRFK